MESSLGELFKIVEIQILISLKDFNYHCFFVNDMTPRF